MKKAIMFMMTLFVSMLCVVPIHAADVKYAEVTDATASDSLLDDHKPWVLGSGTSQVTVEVYGGTYQLLPSATDDVHGTRQDGYTWVGLKFVLPKDSSDVKIGETEYEDDKSDEGHYTFTEYFGFNENNLQTAVEAGEAYYSATWTLTWTDGEEGEQSQKITLIVYPQDVVIKAKEGDTSAWDEAKYLDVSDQKKLEYNVVCQEGAEICDSYSSYIYYPADMTKEDLEAQLRMAVGSDAEDLIIEGIYSDEAMTIAYDFEKDPATGKPAYVNRVVKVTESEENPSTGDNVLTYAVMGTVALVSVLGTTLYFKKVNE